MSPRSFVEFVGKEFITERQPSRVSRESPSRKGRLDRLKAGVSKNGVTPVLFSPFELTRLILDLRLGLVSTGDPEEKIRAVGIPQADNLNALTIMSFEQR